VVIVATGRDPCHCGFVLRSSEAQSQTKSVKSEASDCGLISKLKVISNVMNKIRMIQSEEESFKIVAN